MAKNGNPRDEFGMERQTEDESASDESFAAIVFSLVLAAMGLLFFVKSMAITSKAAIWPHWLSLILIVLASIHSLLAIKNRKRHKNEMMKQRALNEAHGVNHGPFQVSWIDRRRLFTAGWLLAYCLVAKYAGFGPTMLVFLPIYMWISDFRRPVWIIVITLAAAAGLTLLFGTAAGVPIWEFKRL